MIKERWDFREAFFSDIPPSTRGPEKQSVALYSSLAVSHEALFFPNICNREQKPRPGRNVAFFRLDQRMPRNILHPRTKVVCSLTKLWPFSCTDLLSRDVGRSSLPWAASQDWDPLCLSWPTPRLCSSDAQLQIIANHCCMAENAPEQGGQGTLKSVWQINHLFLS